MTPPAPVIRYSPSTREAEIVLDRAAARDLADLVARGQGELAGDHTADPKPYERLLDAVRITPAEPGTEGKVILALDTEARALTITGAPQHLAVLADVVRDMATDPDLRPDTHVHIEYFDGHYYLAESDVSLVLRIAT